jgi:16S rRNA (cytosine967-C5)-methyltransferase
MQTGETSFPINTGNYFDKYFQYASSIISSFKANEPFHIFLKKYFSVNKKHGSRDRRLILSLCYDYFRLGYGVSIEKRQNEKFLLATFLCENNSSPLLRFFKPEWDALISLPLSGKLKIVRKEFDVEQIFPFGNELSGRVDYRQFNLSFLAQPMLFIRIRPGFRKMVINKIKEAGFPFEELNDRCVGFSNNKKVSKIIEIDREAVVQDYNSQRTLDLIGALARTDKSEISIWDCCAGSGGKSILACDIFKKINLTVSDSRKSILENLKARFDKAGVTKYKVVPADLEKGSNEMPGLFDIIIADVPCTGSGTWARTPEQLSFFKKKEIEKYASLQRKIVENVSANLKSDGHLLYVTCSVFKKENEENVAIFHDEYQLDLLQQQYLKGYEMQADTLFVALFKKRK